MLGRGERQFFVGPVDAELVPAERLVGPPDPLDPLADPHRAGEEAPLTGPRGERAERDTGPRHVAHGGTGEAELRTDVGRTVRPHEPVRLRGAVVEGVRPDVVGLPQSAVVVPRVVGLGVQQCVTEGHGTGAARGGGEVGQDREGVVVGERGAEQARLVRVALGEPDRAVVRVGVHGGGEEGPRAARRRDRGRAGRALCRPGRNGADRGERHGSEAGPDERTAAEGVAGTAGHGTPRRCGPGALRALSSGAGSFCWGPRGGSTSWSGIAVDHLSPIPSPRRFRPGPPVDLPAPGVPVRHDHPPSTPRAARLRAAGGR